MFPMIYASLLCWVTLSAAGVIPSCSQVTFTVTVTAQHPSYAESPDPTNETNIVNYVHNLLSGNVLAVTGTQAVSGTVHIDGIYCRPPITTPNDVLEVLVHGISYNKTMWSGLGFGDYYNWHPFANLHGYHTLAIDRLGHGNNPEHPDPFNLVEGSLQVEIMHQIISTLRGYSGSDNALGRKLKKIAYIGHSYGSFLGGAHARLYPDDFDALVLTGYSTSVGFSVVGNWQLASAASIDPGRFPGTPLGYVTTALETQREDSFYGGLYDHSILQADFAYKDTVTDGEIAGLGFILQPAFGYTNPVLLVTGVDDVLFCTPPITTCRATLNASRVFFPDSTNFQYEAIPETGHTLTLHYSAPVTFARVHLFLNQVL